MKLGEERLAQVLYVTGYRSALAILRLTGLLLLGPGMVFVMSFIGSMGDPSLRDVLGLMFGLSLIAVGLWNVIAPSVRGLRAQGVAATLFGVCLGACALTGPANQDTATRIAAIVLVAPFFIWGRWAQVQYRRHRRQFPVALSADAVAFANQLMAHVRGSDPGQSEYAIEFRTTAGEEMGHRGRTVSSLLGPLATLAQAERIRWRGLLFADAVVLTSRGRDVLAGTREDVSIAPQESRLRRAARRAMLQVGTIRLAITISRESLERFEAWRAAPSGTEPEGALASDSPGRLAE